MTNVLLLGMKAGFLEQWKDLPVFVVGKATARAGKLHLCELW